MCVCVCVCIFPDPIGINELAPVHDNRDYIYGDWEGLRHATFDNAFQLPALPVNVYDGSHASFEIDETKIRGTFLNYFVSTLVNYRSYLVRGEKFRKFKVDEFIRAQPSDSRNFFAFFLKTQMWVQFVDERLLVDETDPDVAFFEESLTAKINRCKSKLSISFFSGKKATPFLDDVSFQHHVTHGNEYAYVYIVIFDLCAFAFLFLC